jgi:hypothetical protein
MAVLFLKIQISKALTNLLSELGGLWTAGRQLGNNPYERIVAISDSGRSVVWQPQELSLVFANSDQEAEAYAD